MTATRLALIAGALLVGGATPAADSPRLARRGLWDVGLDATGNGARRFCLADPMILSQWEHRGGSCTRVILNEETTPIGIKRKKPRPDQREKHQRTCPCEGARGGMGHRVFYARHGFYRLVFLKTNSGIEQMMVITSHHTLFT